MFNVLTIYELVGLFATIISAVVIYLRSSTDKRRQNAAFVSILGVVLTLMISIRYDLLPQIQGDLSEMRLIDDNPELRDTIE